MKHNVKYKKHLNFRSWENVNKTLYILELMLYGKLWHIYLS